MTYELLGLVASHMVRLWQWWYLCHLWPAIEVDCLDMAVCIDYTLIMQCMHMGDTGNISKRRTVLKMERHLATMLEFYLWNIKCWFLRVCWFYSFLHYWINLCQVLLQCKRIRLTGKSTELNYTCMDRMSQHSREHGYDGPATCALSWSSTGHGSSLASSDEYWQLTQHRPPVTGSVALSWNSALVCVHLFKELVMGYFTRALLFAVTIFQQITCRG